MFFWKIGAIILLLAAVNSSVAHAGIVWRDPVTGMEFIQVPGGCFQMGQTEEEKRNFTAEQGWKKYDKVKLLHHEVCVDGLWVGRYEVTVGQFRQFAAATGYRTDAEEGMGCLMWDHQIGGIAEIQGANWRNPGHSQRDDHPVVCVSWNDARAFAKWLAKKSGKIIRLLTEAEWEYVTRAGSIGIRYWGNDPADACRYANVHDKTGKPENGFPWPAHQCDDGHTQTAPVGSFSDNDFGLHDMLGNVWEWTCSAHTASYDGSEKNCANTGGTHRVVRGGSWLSFPGSVRSAYRSGIDPDSCYYDLGFRLARQR